LDWFEVDRVGLGKPLERRGKEFALFELLQNAWDQEVTRVAIVLQKEPGSRYATIRIEDDDPSGFKSLEHAWTLFAESGKKGDPEKRGRFNLGEKLVLAVCSEAEIVSTTGAVRFDSEGRQRLRKRRERGTVFEGRIRMTNEEHQACVAAIRRVLPPKDVKTTFNGEELSWREPLAEMGATLATEVADEEGALRPRRRKTVVRVVSPRPGEVGSVYEMGIPGRRDGPRLPCRRPAEGAARA
jgi:hypothetical protein